MLLSKAISTMRSLWFERKTDRRVLKKMFARGATKKEIWHYAASMITDSDRENTEQEATRRIKQLQAALDDLRR